MYIIYEHNYLGLPIIAQNNAHPISGNILQIQGCLLPSANDLKHQNL